MTNDDEVLTLRTGAVSWREVDGETILLDLARSEYLGVNASGTVLWRLIAAGATRAQLMTALREHFHLDDEGAAADVDSFLATARERGLLD